MSLFRSLAFSTIFSHPRVHVVVAFRAINRPVKSGHKSPSTVDTENVTSKNRVNYSVPSIYRAARVLSPSRPHTPTQTRTESIKALRSAAPIFERLERLVFRTLGCSRRSVGRSFALFPQRQIRPIPSDFLLNI